MKWTIHYYNQSVKEDSRDLPISIKAKFEAIMDKMIECGLTLYKSHGQRLI